MAASLLFDGAGRPVTRPDPRSLGWIMKQGWWLPGYADRPRSAWQRVKCALYRHEWTLSWRHASMEDYAAHVSGDGCGDVCDYCGFQPWDGRP
jgi:hypothetical protein